MHLSFVATILCTFVIKNNGYSFNSRHVCSLISCIRARFDRLKASLSFMIMKHNLTLSVAWIRVKFELK